MRPDVNRDACYYANHARAAAEHAHSHARLIGSPMNSRAEQHPILASQTDTNDASTSAPARMHMMLIVSSL